MNSACCAVFQCLEIQHACAYVDLFLGKPPSPASLSGLPQHKETGLRIHGQRENGVNYLLTCEML